jgi:hypothetical protein
MLMYCFSVFIGRQVNREIDRLRTNCTVCKGMTTHVVSFGRSQEAYVKRCDDLLTAQISSVGFVHAGWSVLLSAS